MNCCVYEGGKRKLCCIEEPRGGKEIYLCCTGFIAILANVSVGSVGSSDRCLTAIIRPKEKSCLAG
jgi:hypothetical protein